MKSVNEINYLHNVDIYQGAVNCLQVMRMCNAFVENGMNVTLFFTKYLKLDVISNKDIFKFHGIENKFVIVPLKFFLPRKLLDNFPAIIPLAKAIPYIHHLLKNSIPSNNSVFYSRCYFGAFLFMQIRKWLKRKYTIFFEVHEMPVGAKKNNLLKQMDGLVVITKAIKDEIIETLNISENKIKVEPDAVDLLRYSGENRIDKKEARKKLNLPLDKFIIGYTGQLYPDETNLLIEASKRVPSDVKFIIVGGKPDKVQSFNSVIQKEGIKTIEFVGFVEPHQVPYYQFASDVLIMIYNKGLRTIKYTSPLKMFEYMAASKPIIASDYPAIREILNDGRNAILIEPESVTAIVSAINSLQENYSLRERIAQQAYEDVQPFDWYKRAERIIKFIQRLL